ncbi:MAG: BrnT family toxin [Candidatus Desantisbacteria bacterium]
MDAVKAEINIKKHCVSFDEASTVFQDPLASIFNDTEHSVKEFREIIIGHSIVGHLLVVSFTERIPDLVRIISARPTTKTERKDYEENH